MTTKKKSVKSKPSTTQRANMVDAEMKKILRFGDVWRRIKTAFAAGQLKFDWNGHYKNRVVSNPTEDRSRFFYEVAAVDHSILVVDKDPEATDAVLNKPGSGTISFGVLSWNQSCQFCGEGIPLQFDGITIKATTACKYPNGLGPIEAEIQVPSGQIVFCNYFQNAEPPKDSGAVGAWDFKMETEHYARQNIAYGACGNSCPDVWQRGNDFIIGTPVYDDDDGDKITDGFKGYKRAGGVVTDLWAWSAADVRTAIKHGWKQRKSFGDDVIKVTPGKYKVTQLFHLVDYDNHKVKHKFATLERIK